MILYMPERRPRNVKLPSLSDFVSTFWPWSPWAVSPMSAHGLPATSSNWPLITPSNCAEARGATMQPSAATSATAKIHDFVLMDRNAVMLVPFILALLYHWG